MRAKLPESHASCFHQGWLPHTPEQECPMLRKGDRKHLLTDSTRLLLKRWIPSTFVNAISGGRAASPITHAKGRAKSVKAKQQPSLLSPDSHMSHKKTRSLALSVQLFGGFSRPALKDLDELH